MYKTWLSPGLFSPGLNLVSFQEFWHLYKRGFDQNGDVGKWLHLNLYSVYFLFYFGFNFRFVKQIWINLLAFHRVEWFSFTFELKKRGKREKKSAWSGWADLYYYILLFVYQTLCIDFTSYYCGNSELLLLLCAEFKYVLCRQSNMK